MPCSCGAGAATRVTDANAVLDMDQIIISENSKREYLLAQIRQKDAIIESLLKQVCVCFYPTFSSLPSLSSLFFLFSMLHFVLGLFLRPRVGVGVRGMRTPLLGKKAMKDEILVSPIFF